LTSVVPAPSSSRASAPLPTIPASFSSCPSLIVSPRIVISSLVT
jgi:hypothetical protein